MVKPWDDDSMEPAKEIGMQAAYIRAMDVLHQACVIIAGTCLVIITIIIPWGVFTRFVLNSASSWPEPLAVLLMIVLAFSSAVVCYREYLHIGVGILPAALDGVPRVVLGWIIEICMLATNLFMLWWGVRLAHVTWFQSIAEFPLVSVGISYLPIPVFGAITVLFVIERLWVGKLFQEPSVETVSSLSSE